MKDNVKRALGFEEPDCKNPVNYEHDFILLRMKDM